MSTLIYNCIQIDIIQTVRYGRKPIYDGRTYLYTRHFVHVKGIVDPRATTYERVPSPSTPNVVGDGNIVLPVGANFTNRGVVKTPGQNGNVSDQDIRHLLAQPRRKLLYTAGGTGNDGSNPVNGNPNLLEITFAGGGQTTETLTSPWRNQGGPNPQYTVDANYGPNPLLYDVWRIDGTGCFRVEFAVECWVNEAYLFIDRPPILLANEWSMTQDIDRDGFTSQTVSGRAHFRADVLQQQATVPDDFRSNLIHPVPLGFKRENLRVRAEDDGTTLAYQFTDREMPNPLGDSKAKVARIEGLFRLSSVAQPLIRAGQAAVGNVEKAGTLPGAALAVFTGLTTFIERMMPQVEASVTVRVWGQPSSTRGALLRLALDFLFVKLPQVLDPDVFFTGTSLAYSGDLMGRFVQVDGKVRLGGLSRFIANLAKMDFTGDFQQLLSVDSVIYQTATQRVLIAAPQPLEDRTWGPNQFKGDTFLQATAAALQSWQMNAPQPFYRLGTVNKSVEN